MVYERYRRGNTPQGDYYGRQDPQDYGRDYGSGRDGSYSSARDYQAAGQFDDDRRGYGARDYGHDRYDQREQFGRGRDLYGDRGQDRYGTERHGAERYGSEGRRYGPEPRDRFGGDRQRDADRGRGYGRQPQGYDYEDRGFLARAGDEVRSWFGDEDAERRRDHDARMDARYDNDRDRDYHGWRSSQVAAFDRDYDEYRQENRSKFEQEFATWRTARQGQRDQLGKVTEHMDVVGSDGQHVGTVDKVRGDRIILTKNDADAGGRHHSIPSRWIDKVDTGVTLSKTADEAKAAWRDEEQNQALFGDRQRTGRDDGDRDRERGGTNLNRSFSGTY